MTHAALTVCLVDDDAAVLKVTREVLLGGGYQVRCFQSAAEYLEDSSPNDDCVVTDLNMPGIGGAELLKRIHELDPTLPVIVLTGFADVATAVKLMERGVVTLVEKPCSSIDLLAAVAKAISDGEHRRYRRDQAHDVMNRLAQLNDEELAVMKGVVRGFSNKVLAGRLEMSARTLDRRRHSVFEKMGAESPAELAALAERFDLFKD
ncbi:Transcriptional regulatory protein FixJ [Posidoniimonas polymericola]|uniref:Transcriptional regulatory protein FixJ n=1 Tax=Posidoniimonas polymericola TaxID=2528002 RepID=A0A5C5ZEU6_9BACT|nr:response regulator [Posidoniimonas polymericola]TWT85686.1 Transcriptional regulatory protein FixJ [Posidoniimonas polymericola]